MLDGEGEVVDHGTVCLKARRIGVLLVETAGVVGVRASGAHAALVVEHRQETLGLALDQVQAILHDK